jgi:hypothetical protein
MLNEQLRSLPYIVHTNRELGLMLSGVKKLAFFLDGEDKFPDVCLRYFRLFDRQVAAGRLVRRDRFEPTLSSELRVKRWHHIYFALPSDEWRIDALIALYGRPGPWTEAMEREYGTLLGYEAWQNDVWAAFVTAQREQYDAAPRL